MIEATELTRLREAALRGETDAIRAVLEALEKARGDYAAALEGQKTIWQAVRETEAERDSARALLSGGAK